MQFHKRLVLKTWISLRALVLMMVKRRYDIPVPLILLLVVAVVGWFATDNLGNKARQEIIKESQVSALSLSTYVSSALNHFAGFAKFLAGSVRIAPALVSNKDRDIEDANSTLERYNAALNGSVSYLMDADGMTVASSNRKDPDSFVGKSYRFRPYFQEAAKGQAGRYFALGITSGKRGFYASYPVKDRFNKVLGVVTIKKDLDEMEIFFSKHPLCFLISPEGIIFLSSTPAMVLKSLWPLDKAMRETLIVSQQFGNKVSEAVFKREIVDGTEVTLEGKGYFISRKVIDSDGWSIVLLTPTDRVRFYRWFSILVTISLLLVIIAFFGILSVRNRAKEAIRQSEQDKRLLLRAIGDGIIGVDATGQVSFVNPAAVHMLGFSFEEMLGRNLHDLIHHSREDGSTYPVEDNPLYDSLTEGVDSHVPDEVIWRKDGSSLSVEYSSTPIIVDSSIKGAVVTLKDITERKQLEEKIRQMAGHDSPTGLQNIKISIIYNSVSDNTQRLAELIAQGALLSGRVEIKSMNLDRLDEEFVQSSKALILGCPTHSGVISDQMDKWIRTTKLDLAGKIGSVFATESFLKGRSDDHAEIKLVDNLLALGVLVYSGGTSSAQPNRHYGAIVLIDDDDDQEQHAKLLGERVAKKALELFGNGT
jgi:PAS domain S-box-containing protein